MKATEEQNLANKIFHNGGCLSKDILLKYSAGSLDEKTVRQVEEHTLDCELCDSALQGIVPGITLSTFTNIEKEIDQLTHKNSSSPNSSKGYLKTGLTIIATAGVCYLAYYLFSTEEDSSNKKPIVQSIELPPPFTSENETEIIFTDSVIQQEPTIKEMDISGQSDLGIEIAERKTITPISNLNYDSGKIVIPSKDAFIPERPVYLSTYGYIDSLKITAFNKYYAKHKKLLPYTLSGTPAEYGEDTSQIEQGYIQVNPVEKMLKNAIVRFKTGEFRDALVLFEQLMEYDPNDINALFYAGVCHYYLNELETAGELMSRSLEHNNDSFYSESRWFRAKILLGLSRKKEAITILKKINKEPNDFYNKKAAELLQELGEPI